MWVNCPDVSKALHFQGWGLHRRSSAIVSNLHLGGDIPEDALECYRARFTQLVETAADSQQSDANVLTQHFFFNLFEILPLFPCLILYRSSIECHHRAKSLTKDK